MYKEANVYDLLGKRQILTWDYGKGSGGEEESFSGGKGGESQSRVIDFFLLLFIYFFPGLKSQL